MPRRDSRKAAGESGSCGLLCRPVGAIAWLAQPRRPALAGIAGVRCAGICHIASMDETNLEIIVALGSWQTPGKAARWYWQVRQKAPPKFLVKGVTLGTKQRALDSSGQGQDSGASTDVTAGARDLSPRNHLLNFCRRPKTYS
jgi:hypothetical protein